MQKSLKILVPVLILLFLLWTISRNWLFIRNQLASANLILLFLSLTVLVITHIGGAFFWHRILHSISVKIPFKEALRVFIVSNFGRFIPGIVLHYVARVYLSKDLGLSVKEGISSVFLEAYYTLAGALIISTLALPVAIKYTGFAWLPLAAIVIVALILVISPQKVFTLAGKLPYLGGHIPAFVKGGGVLNNLTLLGISSTLFFLDGVAFFLLSAAFITTSLPRLLDLSGLFSAAWIVGFLTPVAPGGLGVSDLSFAFLLTIFYDFSFASLLAVIFRFGMLLSEGVIFLFVVKLSGFNVISAQK